MTETTEVTPEILLAVADYWESKTVATSATAQALRLWADELEAEQKQQRDEELGALVRKTLDATPYGTSWDDACTVAAASVREAIEASK